MSTDPQAETTEASADQEGAEQADQRGEGSADVRGSNYEVIRDRLEDQATELRDRADQLNDKRREVFGGTEMTVAGQVTIRTENNCIPQDIVNIGGRLLFGYNVQIGMKSSTSVDDVFSLHKFDKTDDGFSVDPMPEDSSENFLGQEQFLEHFDDLYTYYDDVRLRNLMKLETRLLAVFQTGTTREDIRVLRWGLDADGNTDYMDNTGERDMPDPDQQDFEWQPVTRDDHVTGKHPHVSILDEVFVETVGGDLTIKIEDNTERGQGIYDQPVEDPHQSLGDAEIEYVEIGSLILIKILPYREDEWRYFVFNTLTEEVRRIDAVGQACVTLPEQHGIIFPGGYVLSEGHMREFDIETEGMRFQERIRSANGEDVMYVFYRPQDGTYLLLSYNVIRKDVENPIDCHGYSLFRDGTMVVFQFTGEEATRVHPMQIWQTPYHSDEYAAEQPTDDSLLSNLGNAELVRGVSDLLGLCRMIDDLEPSVSVYEALIKSAQQLIDNYFWLAEDEVGDIATLVEEVVSTAELVVEEFQKVQSLKKKAAEKLQAAEDQQDELLLDTRYSEWKDLERFVEGLSQLREQRGKLITLKDVRYIDEERLDELEKEVSENYDELTQATVDFLLSEDALAPYREDLESLSEQVKSFETTKEGEQLQKKLEQSNEQLTLLTDVVSGLQIDDPNQRTEILESIGEILGRVNKIRSKLDNRITEIREEEGKAEFAVQFQLLDQTINSALGMADTPEACDEQLTRVLTQLEDLESQFSEFDNFLEKLSEKRNEIYDTFESRKQTLLEERQRRARQVAESAERVLESILRRASDMESIDDLNAFFASDQMVMKVRDQIDKLRDLGEDVRADDLQTQLKKAKDQSIRKLRDKIDLFEGGEDVIKLGRHQFSVNTQDVELTMVPRDGEMMLHITGTDFFQPVDSEEFQATREFWDQPLVSETDNVYRAEYLAATILFDAEDSDDPPNVSDLHEKKLEEEGLIELVRDEMTERFDEGYERGVHDEDATDILGAVVDLYTTAGLLRYTPPARAIACLYWAHADEDDKTTYARRAASLGRLRSTFDQAEPLRELGDELGDAIAAFAEECDLQRGPRAGDDGHVGRFTDSRCREAGRYLAEELVDESPTFIVGDDAATLRKDFGSKLDRNGTRLDFEGDLEHLQDDLGDAYDLVEAWVSGFEEREADDLAHVVPEAVALILTEDELERNHTSTTTRTSVGDLLGQHPRIDGGTIEIRLDEFITRLRQYIEEHVPAWQEYRRMSREIAERERQRMNVDELEPQVLSTFVRNTLIDEVYLPMVGDNLAKQMGTAGESTRSDRSGLLFLISPPGYGKTTLMEYIAKRLGVMFVKINGPALGHDVTSLDPSEAPNATAREEVEKINFGLEMGNNTILYVDDVQHTAPEFLQKFISLCDSTRQIEGVWNGETKTYDLRGKRFAVMMGGNPYTESGERFQVPDMLANRADIYNLGDILSGNRGAFEKSYVENALAANGVTAPLVSRDNEDIDRFIRLAEGEQVPLTDMSYDYSSVEANEIKSVLEKFIQIRDVVLKVNQQYIESAGKRDEYRDEPPFQLQGSYRNMNSMAEKIAAAMNEEEVEQIIDDHYRNEAQTLTTGAEQNLLKLKELRGRLTDEEKQRWREIKDEFQRRKMMGGDDDPVSRVAGPLSTLVQRVEDVQGALDQDRMETHLAEIRDALVEAADAAESVEIDGEVPATADGGSSVEAARKAAEVLHRKNLQVEIDGDMTAKFEEMLDTQLGLIESAIVPLAKAVHQHFEQNDETNEQLDQVLDQLNAIERA